MKHWDFISGGKTFSFSATNEFSFVMFGWFHSIEEFTFEWNLRIVLIFSFRGFQLNLYRIGKKSTDYSDDERNLNWMMSDDAALRSIVFGKKKKTRYSSRWWYSIIARWIFLCVHEQALTQSKRENPSIKKRVFYFFTSLFLWCGMRIERSKDWLWSEPSSYRMLAFSYSNSSDNDDCIPSSRWWAMAIRAQA